jgi:hypothetical protein
VKLRRDVGKALITFFAGEGITEAKAYLEQCSMRYDKAISNVVVVRLLVNVGLILKGKFCLLPKRLTIREGYFGWNPQ